MSEPELLCHEFWVSLIEQTSSSNDLELAILLPIAILSLSPCGTGFREVYNFATDLSAFKKLVRFAAIQSYQDKYAGQADTSYAHGTENQSGLTLEEAEQLWQREEQLEALHLTTESENRSRVDRFEHWVLNYLTTKYPTPMNWLILTARYASRFRYGENLDAFVQWNGDNVTVRSVRTSLSQLRNAVWNEYGCASAILQQLCFAESLTALLPIPWDTMDEQATRSTAGYSAFSPNSLQLLPHQKFVSHQLLEAVRSGKHNKYAITDLSDLARVTAYSDLVQKFLGHLLCLVHLTSGQPARGTELLSIQHKNTVANRLRNIFLFNGLVAIVP